MISLAIPHYSSEKYGNRIPFLLTNLKNIYNKNIFSEIIICDDSSDIKYQYQLKDIIKEYPTVKLYFHNNNLGGLV
jgi:glycosyltransferase involved in cell wall biosynthesis